jgi:hypothetical protein
LRNLFQVATKPEDLLIANGKHVNAAASEEVASLEEEMSNSPTRHRRREGCYATDALTLSISIRNLSNGLENTESAALPDEASTGPSP